jgi:hypothetical protein
MAFVKFVKSNLQLLTFRGFSFDEYFFLYVYFLGRYRIYQIGNFRTYKKCTVLSTLNASPGLMFKENSCIDYEPPRKAPFFRICGETLLTLRSPL